MNTNKHEFGGAMRAAGSRRQARIECSIDMMDKMDRMDKMDSGMESRGAAAKLAVAAMIALVAIAGCSTEIKVNGNYNSIDTSPAKYAGYGSTVDVLKGMSLPSLSLGSSSAKATEDRGKEEKTATDEETKAAEAPVTDETQKNGGNGVLAEVEAPEAKVTEDKVEVKAEQGTANERE